MSITRDSKPHVIVVERADEEAGEIEWHVEHNDTCQTETFDPAELGEKGSRVEFYVCGVQHDLDCIGLASLAHSLGYDMEFQIPPGRYIVIGVYSFNAYTREGDFWYEEQSSENVTS